MKILKPKRNDFEGKPGFVQSINFDPKTRKNLGRLKKASKLTKAEVVRQAVNHLHDVEFGK